MQKIIVIFLFLITFRAYSQDPIMTINGAQVTFSTNSVVQINGKLDIRENGILNQYASNLNIINDLLLSGTFNIYAGIINLGQINNISIIYQNTDILNQATLNIFGGEFNVAGSFRPLDATRVITFNMTGGVFRLGNYDITLGTGYGLFHIASASSNFNMSGGTIELKSEMSDTAYEFFIENVSNNVTGGLLLITPANSNEVFELDASAPVWNFQIAGTYSPQVIMQENFVAKGDITLAGTGADRFDLNELELSVGGNINNNLSLKSGLNVENSTITLNGSVNQNIQGTQATDFNLLVVNKSGGMIELNHPARIEENLFLISNTQFDLNSNDLTLSEDASVYSDNGSNKQVNIGFSINKCLINSGSGSDPLNGAFLIKELPASYTGSLELTFPIATPGLYSPAMITFNPSGVNLSADALVKVKPVPQEHPEVESPNVSLQKYWVVDSENLTVNDNGINIRAFYNASEVEGSEGSYNVLLYSPSYDDPTGYWRVNPGESDDIIDFNDKLWYSQQSSILEGDWTIGESSAALAVYYARQDGDWDDPNTWSKVYYDGAASTTIPNKLSDVVRIQNHTVTVNSAPAGVNLVSVEDGTEGRDPGVLVITDNYYMQGDTFRLEANTTLKVQNDDGIAAVPATIGAIRTDVVDLSEEADYWFLGGSNQSTGDGLPLIIKKIIVDKTAGSTLELAASISVSDSLIINDGIFDLADKSINGLTTDRKLLMKGGELIIRSNFPSNYSAPEFEFGKITFEGTGAIQIPSSGSTPGVLQYNDLKISGNRSGDITFRQSGSIKIKNEFDISTLNFDNNTFKFQTFGSTVVFNKNGGIQDIPTNPQAPADSICRLEYYNLTLDSAGTKRLNSAINSIFVVRNDLTINNTAAFESNGSDLMVQGDWVNNSGTFNPGTNFVVFNSDVVSQTITIQSRDVSDNPFYSIKTMGAGIVEILDDLLINNDLIIDTTNTMKSQTSSITINGDWKNNGGTYDYGTSEVFFTGSTLQNITKTSGNQEFYDLTINNVENVNSQVIGGATNGIIVNNDLSLEAGRIISRGRFVQVMNSLTRVGGGYVDGELRKVVAEDAASVDFEVGFGTSYLPAELDFTGTGGVSGLISVISDTITTASSPLSWDSEPPSDILPAGSSMSPERHVARQWNVTIPPASSFELGADRKFDAVFNFIPGNNPNGDLRNSADDALFEARVYNGSDWIAPFEYGTYPFIGALSNSSTEYKELIDFGAYIIGEPNAVSFYSINNGDWDEPTNWSQQGYDGSPSATYPGEGTNVFKAFIGDSKKIDLNLNITCDDNATTQGIVQVDSSGYLNLQSYIIGGTGEFRLNPYSIVEIGSDDGIEKTGSTGNIQTTTRNYNYNSHNWGTFIYSGVNNQVTGLGIPTPTGGGTDTIYKLIINKPDGTNLAQSGPAGIADFHIKDSLYIKGGEFRITQKDVFIYHVIRKEGSGDIYVPTNRIIYFRGSNPIYVIADDYTKPFIIDKVDIFKEYNTGDIILGANTNLEIVQNLNFVAGNKSVIDATTFSTEDYPLYVKIRFNATVTGAGHIDFDNSGGWVWGEIHKNVQANDAPEVTFETGTSLFYSPFAIDFANGSGSANGYLSGTAIEGDHPKLYPEPPSLYPISPNRNITVYWRLKKPAGSTFERGDRAANYTVKFINPDQQTNTDCFGCADVAFYRGGDSLSWWQGMARNSTFDNSGIYNYCGDTRIPPHGPPAFDYGGDACGATIELGTIVVLDVPSTLSFGSTDTYTNGDLLLAEFVAGNRNSIKYYKFYSIKDGDWSDPTTWSTESYSSTVNAAASDTDPLVRPIPSRQYDNVYIGNGKKVKLDVIIGTNVHYDPRSQYTFAGPSVFVENTGTLDLTTSVLRGNQFNAMAGSTIIIGSNDGISPTNSPTTGNIQLSNFAINVPSYSDSINVVYAPSGRTSDGAQRALVDRNSLTHYIESVTIRRASDDAIIMQYTSDNKFLSDRYGNPRSMASCSLEVGESYYLEINPSDVATNRKYKVFAEWDYDGNMSDGNEQLSNNNSSDINLVTTSTFTVPADLNKGSALLRVGMAGNTTDFAWNAGGRAAGEFEDYTIHIMNPDYVATQVNGAGLPTLLQSFTVNSPNPAAANPQFNLEKEIIVIDDISIKSGKLNQGAYDISLYGDFIQDTLNGFVAHSTNPVKFLGNFSQNITGSENITFNNVEINKTGTNKVNVNNDITINATLTFNSDNNLLLNPLNTITFGTTGAVSSGGGSFSENRMIETDGDSDNSKVIKNFYNTNYSKPTLRWGNTADRYITNVTYGTLNNTSGKSGYSDFTYLTPPTITAGVSTPLSLTRTLGAGGSLRWRIWIDYNKNGVFDGDSERPISNNNSSVPYIPNITIPVTALNGLARMRVKIGGNNSPDQNAIATEGEYEDYLINITGGTDLPNQNFAFLFPIGANDIYSPADIDITATQTAEPTISLLMRDEKHPERQDENILSRYWTVESTGIADITADEISFTFDNSDVSGDVDEYIPARYTDTWEINLGEAPDIVGTQILISPTVTTKLNDLDGDWTSGIPNAFFAGRIFYSRNTGNWNDKDNWSNDPVLKHLGAPSQYFPGDIYFQDTVNIDGHFITFNLDTCSIDSLRIGGTNSIPDIGTLHFNNVNNKRLKMRSIFMDNDAGILSGDNTGNRIDTLSISGNIINNSTGGFNLFNNANNYTLLNLQGSGNSLIAGTGDFNSFGQIILNKSGGLADTLINTSATFAQATVNSTDYQFLFKKGVLDHDINEELSLASNQDTQMEPFSAILIEDGEISVNGSLSTDANTFITLDGGDLTVGNSIDENYIYQSGSTIDIIDGRMQVAGAFTRLFNNSTLNLSLNNDGEIIVASSGYTDPSKIGFDLSNSANIFNMSGGRIIVANANPTASYDIFINAESGTLMTDGTIQIGDTALSVNNTTFKVGGSMPVHNIHFVNDGVKNIYSNLLETSYTVNNIFETDELHVFNLNGNTLNIGGNIINNGVFNAVPGAATTDPWLVSFFGNQIQSISNTEGDEFEVYNMQLNKSDNYLLMDNSLGSNLLIRNNLEFASANVGYIDVETNDQIVQTSPLAFNNSSILRVGEGHIYGWLYRNIKSGSQDVFFPVGTDSYEKYRYARFKTASDDNTAGLIGIRNIDGQHPNFDNGIINDNNYVNAWWQVETPASGGFVLGADQTYTLETNFRNPDDLVGTGDYMFFEHFLYTSSNWEFTNTSDISSTSVTSSQHSVYGDFAIGEPVGVTFYSIADGSWDDPNTWSLTGYDTPNVPARYPNLNTDIVRIGNGKRVVLPDLIYPEVRSIFVEMYNDKPGTLKIAGELGYLRGNTFVLEDSCTIELDHLQGIQPIAYGPTGAVQTDSRQFGVSRYVYNSTFGSQTTGLGLPPLVKTIIVDNANNPNKTVFLSNAGGSPEVNILDTLLIRQGIFDSGNRGIKLYSEMILDSITNNGSFQPLNANFTFGGDANDKHLIISNNSGALFNNLIMEQGDLIVKREGTFNVAKADVFVNSTLNFAGQSVVQLGDGVNFFINNNDPNAILNYANDRYIRTSRTSGSLARNLSTSGLPKTYSYPIGSYESADNYAPVELTVQSGSTGGYVSFRTSPGDFGGFPGGHTGINNNPNAEYLERYWGVDTVSANITGKIRFNYIDSEFDGAEANMNRLGRWRPELETTPGSWFQQPLPNIDIANNYFETSDNYSSSEYRGDWTIGNIFAFRRIFYSRQNGNWSDPNAWTFDPSHTGAIFGPGIWPDLVEDSVVIGGGDAVIPKHEIILDVNANVQGTALGTSPTNRGILNTNGYNLLGDYFTMADYSHLKVSSPDGITTLGNATGNIQTDVTRVFNPLGIYEYNGNTNQNIGNGLPSQFESLIISNTGNQMTNSDNVILDKDLIINDDLTVNRGTLNMVNFKADKATPAGDFAIAANAQVKIGGTNNILLSLNNYNSYSIDEFSIFNFNGSDQVISTLPAAISTGLGNVYVQNPGTKSVTAPFLIRGNLYISNDATLQNEVGNNSLSVKKNIINSAAVNNYGIIEIGE